MGNLNILVLENENDKVTGLKLEILGEVEINFYFLIIKNKKDKYSFYYILFR